MTTWPPSAARATNETSRSKEVEREIVNGSRMSPNELGHASSRRAPINEHESRHSSGLEASNCGEQAHGQSMEGDIRVQSEPLAAAFAFNPYQDIICGNQAAYGKATPLAQASGQCRPTGRLGAGKPLSTFNASELRRKFTLARTGENTRQFGSAKLIRTEAGHKATKLGHSRRESISRASEAKSSISNLPSAGAGQSRESLEYSNSKALLGRENSVFEETSLSEKLNSNSNSNQQLALDDNRSKPIKQKMSQTIQSIHSLSMQLNRAASHGELSGFQSPLPSQVLVGASAGANSGPNQGQANSQHQANRLARLVGKKAARVKELLLQNLGKADKTHDELFKLYEENFHKQQAQAMKLQKEFKIYISSLKQIQEVDKSLNECIQQSTNDYNSLSRHDLICENLSQVEHLNDDLMDKLRNQIMSSINEYLSQFHDLKEKISKRHRKLIDYDSSKRIYELTLASISKKRQQAAGQDRSSSLRSFRSAFLLSSAAGAAGPAGNGQQVHQQQVQTATNQLVDEARLLKLREQYNYCRVMYETINSELHEELPMIYEKKMKHLLMTLQSYFSLEAQFHLNAGKLFATASDVIDELPLASLRSQANASMAADNYTVAGKHQQQLQVGAGCAGSSGMGSSRGDSSMESSSASPESRAVQSSDDEDEEAVEVVDFSQVEIKESFEQREIEHDLANQGKEGEEAADLDSELDLDEQQLRAEGPISYISGECAVVGVAEVDEDSKKPQQRIHDEEEENFESAAVEAPEEAQTEANEEIVDGGCVKSSEQQEELDFLLSEAKQERDYNCLYKVKTSYKYLAEDVDELCFEADEIIQVIELTNSQEVEPEEGWLMGIREVNGQRGLFPANFTEPI